ncbi:hypothetical protein [Lacinutrix sp. Hel_I_90]|uniref:hypothetical protein n=1 Tax=Lacinutrix sp. Hel_I_90 TaxID=1249999 RepID=UPI0005C8F329|nr:hypothetical protein [Lacinutrix sp. Hel_I_90]
MNLVGKILTGVAVASITSLIFARKKVQDVKAIAEKLTFGIDRINKVDFKNGGVVINVDILLKNNSNINFELSTGTLLSLKKVQVFTVSGYQIAEAQKELNNISLLANNATLIPNVEIFIDTSNIGGLFINLFTIKKEDLITRAHLEIFGKPFVV